MTQFWFEAFGESKLNKDFLTRISNALMQERRVTSLSIFITQVG